ncbi:Endothelin-converting enzyme-like 1 [Stylophora pistillata]|uniref:Endothelin-converting enzyme-like 1 n=1 Tax=Stylophora pistillata TaxID=50429 RepID=A0A2B4SSU4_STYPI|nr:Endothelin-converting enzyme-like 1 [Stylophora pistillata]
MADPKYRLAMEEMHLDGHSNSADDQVIRNGKPVQRNGCATPVLVFLVVLLSLACISLVVFLAMGKLQRNDEIRRSFCGTVLNASNASENVTPQCTSVQCILASANVLRTVDQSVDPCEDFFLHACGGWIKNNPIPPNEPLWNQVLALKKRNDQLLKTLLSDETVRKRYSEIDQTTHTITRDAYLANTSYHYQVREAYQKLMSELINLLGGESEWAEHQLKEVFEFEQNLSKLSATANERADRSKVYKLMTLKKLQNQTGEQTKQKFDHLGYYRAICVVDRHPDRQTEKYQQIVHSLLSKTKESRIVPHRILANYMMWQAVVQLAPHLSEEYRRAFYNYHRVVMGSTGETDIWKKCITEMSRLDNHIGDPLGVIFLDEKFEKKDKESVRALFYPGFYSRV